MEELAKQADLILVFLDPVGQALCHLTATVIQTLSVRGAGLGATPRPA